MYTELEIKIIEEANKVFKRIPRENFTESRCNIVEFAVSFDIPVLDWVYYNKEVDRIVGIKYPLQKGKKVIDKYIRI